MKIFFPQAEKKGASPSEYGLVFGIFELVVFIVSPFYGQHVSDDIMTNDTLDKRCNCKDHGIYDIMPQIIAVLSG
jgi:hypothetical protein